MAPLIANAIRQGAQIIVSTRSDHFIAGIIAAIAKGQISESDVKAYYMREEEGEVRAIEVGLSPKAFIKHCDLLP